MGGDYALYLGVGRLGRLKLMVMLLLLLLMVLLRCLGHLLNVNRLVLLMVLLMVRLLGHMLNDVMRMYDGRACVRMMGGNCCGCRYNFLNVDKLCNWGRISKRFISKMRV